MNPNKSRPSQGRLNNGLAGGQMSAPIVAPKAAEGKSPESTAGFQRATLKQILREAWPNSCVVYVVSRPEQNRPLYVGATTMAISWRLKRHLHDGSSQASSKLSNVLRSSWPDSASWLVEIVTPDEVTRRCEPWRSGPMPLRRAEMLWARRLRPTLSWVGSPGRQAPSARQGLLFPTSVVDLWRAS